MLQAHVATAWCKRPLQAPASLLNQSGSQHNHRLQHLHLAIDIHRVADHMQSLVCAQHKLRRTRHSDQADPCLLNRIADSRLEINKIVNLNKCTIVDLNNCISVGQGSKTKGHHNTLLTLNGHDLAHVLAHQNSLTRGSTPLGPFNLKPKRGQC